MFRFILLIVFQALVVFYVFPYIDPNFRVRGDFGNAVIVVLLFAFLNLVLRWIFFTLTLGIGWILYYISLGILGLVLNAVILVLIDRFFQDLLMVPNFWMALVGGFLLALVNFLLGYSRK